MASFDLLFPMMMNFEGGYVDDPSDPGGETNKGITMAMFQQSSHELLGIEPTSENLKALTDGQASILYKALYWDKIAGDDFQLQELANIVCDFYVVAGTHAITLLQRVMNGMGAQVAVDGSIGPGLIQALNVLSPKDVYRQYKQGRIQYYQTLGNRYPMFMPGWLNRVNSFPDL